MQEISFLMSTKTTQMTDKIGVKDTSHPWEKMFFLCSYLIENNSNNWQAQVQEQIPSPREKGKGNLYSGLPLKSLEIRTSSIRVILNQASLTPFSPVIFWQKQRLFWPILRHVWEYSQHYLFWVWGSTLGSTIPLLRECSQKSGIVLLGVLLY